MKRLLSSAVISFLVLKSAAVAAGELPSFELAGFPISPHQVAVMGSANVQEAPPAPRLTFHGMPASPHQIAVLISRPRMIDEMLTLGLSKTVDATRH